MQLSPGKAKIHPGFCTPEPDPELEAVVVAAAVVLDTMVVLSPLTPGTGQAA